MQLRSLLVFLCRQLDILLTLGNFGSLPHYFLGLNMLIKFSLLILIVNLIACGNQGSSIDVSHSQTCTVSGNTISCPDGSTVTLPTSNFSMVQFCSQYTTTYPNSFPEFGICSNNILYAVYWNGTNAWLAEIAPGNYMSTSSTSPCNFTVGSNCIVSQ
jgi:hypothetical protein